MKYLSTKNHFNRSGSLSQFRPARTFRNICLTYNGQSDGLLSTWCRVKTDPGHIKASHHLELLGL